MFDIEKMFPKAQYIRCIQDNVIDELFFDNNNCWYDRAGISKFYNEKDLLLHKSSDVILCDEYFKGVKKVSLLEQNNTEIQNFLDVTYAKIDDEEKYLKFRADRISLRDQQWRLIPVYDQHEIVIENNRIWSLLDLHIKDNIPLTVPLNSDSTVMLRIVGRKVFPSFSDSFVDKSMHIKIVDDLKNELPTIYSLLIYAIFMDQVARPLSIYDKVNLDDDFNIKIASQLVLNDFSTGEEEKIYYIKLSRNFIPDFRIGLMGLHYVDFFVTSDKFQAALLNYLFPQYTNKIVWCMPPKKNIQHTIKNNTKKSIVS